MSRNQINCDHNWEILTYDKGDSLSVSKCKKCGLWLYHSKREKVSGTFFISNLCQKKLIIKAI